MRTNQKEACYVKTVASELTWFGTLDRRGRFMLDIPLIWFTAG